jgi:hypothetical protein
MDCKCNADKKQMYLYIEVWWWSVLKKKRLRGRENEMGAEYKKRYLSSVTLGLETREPTHSRISSLLHSPRKSWRPLLHSFKMSNLPRRIRDPHTVLVPAKYSQTWNHGTQPQGTVTVTWWKLCQDEQRCAWPRSKRWSLTARPHTSGAKWQTRLGEAGGH